jgi:type IV pilus assembly protein PilB
VAEQYELPYLQLTPTDVNLRAARLLSEESAREFAALPISVLPDASVLVAVSDPTLVLFSEQFRKLLGVPLRYAVAAQDELDAAIAYALCRVPDAATQPDDPTVVAVADDTADDLLVADDVVTTLIVPEHPRAHRSAALGALLVRDGLVTEDELDAALAQQRIAGNKRLGEILVERGAVTRSQVARLVAEQYDLPFVELDLARVDVETALLLPESLAHRLSALPLGRSDDESLLVAVSDPTNVVYADELHVVLDAPIRFVVVTPDEIDEALHHVHLEAPEAVAAAEPVVEENPWLERLDDDLLAEVGEVAETAFEADSYPQIVPLHEPLAEVVELVADTARVGDETVALDADAAAADVEAEDGQLAAVHVLPADVPHEEAPEDRHAEETEEADDIRETVADDVPDQHEDSEETTVAVVEEAVDEPHWAEEDEPAEVESAVDEVLRRALSLGAATIQLAPHPRGLVARCRIDGSMHDLGTLEEEVPGQVTAGLMARAGLDPSRLAPQHGMLAVMHEERAVDLAVAAVPTKLGVQLALRSRSQDGRPTVLSDLGLRPEADASLREALRASSGVVVVAGLAVSGRTTTLYAALREVATPERVVATIEDPVEELVAGAGQVEVDAAAGMTVAGGLRALLRSDSDVVLVGDLRDAETAQVAFRGARAERSVLLALESSDAASAVARLSSLGVDAQLLASTLSCVVAQSLVRRVCTDCRETYYASAEEIESLGRPEEEAGRRLLARGRGCASCGGTGYRGWKAVFESLPLTEDIRMLLARGAGADELRDAAVAAGMSTVRDEVVGLCLDGVTTPSEARLVG